MDTKSHRLGSRRVLCKHRVASTHSEGKGLRRFNRANRFQFHFVSQMDSYLEPITSTVDHMDHSDHDMVWVFLPHAIRSERMLIIGE